MIKRSSIYRPVTLSAAPNRLVEMFLVQTDEDYKVQYGDSTIEVSGDANLIFDDVRVEGYSFWVIRNNRYGCELMGYLFEHGKWIEVSKLEVR